MKISSHGFQRASVETPPRRALAAAILVSCLVFAPNAFAYLDPGTGSILLQGLIATFVGVVTWGSLTWRRTKAWLRVTFGQDKSRDDEHAGRN